MMNVLRKGLGIIAACLLAVGSAHAREVVAEGVGDNFSQAVKNALKHAVEQAIGVDVATTTVVGNFEMLRDDIMTHAQGYVTDYDIVTEGTDARGAYVVKLRANVNAGRIRDHVEALDILMKLAGHPRVAVLALDDGLESVSPVMPDFNLLTDTVAKVFSDDFRFTVVNDGKRVPNKNRKEALAAVAGKADYAILVRLDAKRRLSGALAGAELSLEGVRIEGGEMISAQSAVVPLPRRVRRADDTTGDRIAIDAVLDQVFPLGVELAQAMVDDIQAENASGGGVRYTLGFYNLPQDVVAGLRDDVRFMPGFVRLRLETMSDTSIEFSYWSGLRNDELNREIEQLLDEKGIAHRFRVEGRVLKYKAVDPTFE